MGVKLSSQQADALSKYVESLPDHERSSFVTGFQKLPEDGQMGLVDELVSKASSIGVKETPIPDGRDIWAQRGDTAQTEIAGRGQLLSNIQGNLQSPSLFKKTLGGIQTLGAPMTAFEAGVANPALQMQQGNFNLPALGREALLGVTGQKLGEYGDVMRVAGAPKPLAATGGLLVSLGSPLAVLNRVNKAFGSISKMSDNGIIKAGEDLVKASEAAGTHVANKLDEAFKGVNSVQVDPNIVYEVVSKLPKPLIAKMEETFGPIEDFVNGLDIAKVRQIKAMMGKYNPGSFGKETRGLEENLNAEEISKAYAAIKEVMEKTINDAVGKKSAQKLFDLEDAATEVIRAGNSVKKTIVDATLKKPTKAGAMAGKLVVEGDTTGRTALNTLRNQGGEARKAINEAVSALEKFNRAQKIAKAVSHGISALTYGGAIGAVGGGLVTRGLKKSGSND